MPWTPTGWQWAPTLLVLWGIYEIIRYVVVGTVKARYEAQVDRFMRQNKIPHDNFRHTHRVVVKELVMADPGLAAAIARRAEETGENFVAVQARVREWLDEIVPQFNLLAYYKIGYGVAKTLTHTLYNVRLDRRSWDEAQEKVPEGASIVLVSNHRSNADFVVTGFMVSKSVQVSYAVGEWARVWPLESLFKSFGSYFVRRGEKDWLYHRTLEAYVQLITKQGVTQAVFPEGGLSRNGRLRDPKLGILDYMVRAKRDPEFRRPLVFLPVGINFDRVVEDENMVQEWQGQKPRHKRTAWTKVKRLVALLGKGTVSIVVNLWRLVTRRVKKSGVCAIRFGEPIVFDDWYQDEAAQRGPFLDDEDRKRRQQRLVPFAQTIMDRIGRVMPVTAVPLTCAAMRHLGRRRLEDGVDRGDLVFAVRQTVERLQHAGAPFFTGDPYFGRSAASPMDHTYRGATRGPIEPEDLDDVIALAVDILQGRNILHTFEGRFYTEPERWSLVEYYANSLECHLEPKPPAARTTIAA